MSINQVTIIETTALSVSIALKLKEEHKDLTIVGYSADAAAADLARARGAFERVEREPGPACEDADLIIVTTPIDSIREMFAAIAPHLRPGSLVTDTAELKAPVARWAEEILPQDAEFVGGHILLNPTLVDQSGPSEEPAEAHADLLQHALYCFTPLPETSAAAIDTCSNLARSLEAYPFFIDVTEHDGLEAIRGLIDLTSIALLRSTIEAPGWQEMRKFAGERFATTTEPVTRALERQHAILLNREHVVRRLDVLLEELMHLRALLTEDEEENLAEAFLQAAEGRQRWLQARQKGMWVEKGTLATEDVPGRGESLTRMIFGGLGARLKKASGRDQDE
jgi:prephenate dehydrogenase